ncbi:hypothetical protein AVEN_270699-1 [Araneus ventricosus]|uniref:Uncharacterized protein n=1 Tax=Araneus ventricosus TaxID=182803 RepID=A0A4Y2FDD0_ARAVE|nr:hypothetical protein AVEN_270699-1 [Araneus ventricosus]
MFHFNALKRKSFLFLTKQLVSLKRMSLFDRNQRLIASLCLRFSRTKSFNHLFMSLTLASKMTCIKSAPVGIYQKPNKIHRSCGDPSNLALSFRLLVPKVSTDDESAARSDRPESA